MNLNPDHVEAKIKLTIAVSFCITIMSMVILSMYSLVFVTQPMSGIAPADKQFFFLLSDMSKYILGSLGTLLAIKGKDAIKEMLPPKDEPKKEQEEIK